MVCNLKNGSCSKCGGCCSNILPLTDDEKKRIKHIIKKKKLKPSYHIPFNGLDMTCPLLDGNNQCRIYEDSPTICRVYRCDKTTEQGAVEFDNGYTTASITLIFNTRYNPRKNETVQQKINFEKNDDLASEIMDKIEELPEKVTVEVVGNDTYVEEKELDNLMSEAEKLEEEFEDDFDPMLA